MKNKSDYTKKLIKNVTALITAGLVLIAATIAWFASNAETSVRSMSTKYDGIEFTIRYYRASNVPGTFKSLGESGAVSLETRQGSTLGWTEVNSLDVSNLFPGEYAMFRIDIQIGSSSTPHFVLNDIRCTSDPTKRELIFNSLFVNMLAVQEGTLLDSSTDSLSNLVKVRDGKYYIDELTIPQMESSSFSVYLDVGMPGADVNNTHEALRLTGATVEIGSVTVDT